MSNKTNGGPPKGTPQTTGVFKGDALPPKPVAPESKNVVPPKGKPQPTPPFKKNL